MKLLTLIFLSVTAIPVYSQDTLGYRIEMSANVSDGDYAPLWFTGNRHGLSAVSPNSGYMRVGVTYDRVMGGSWRMEAALDLAATKNGSAPFVAQQAYADISWKKLTLSVGSKERGGFPLYKNPKLTSGMMVEGLNSRPVPQVRIETNDYVTLPFTKKWLSLKGHFAFGMLTDGNWRADYFAPGETFVRNAVYHTKSLMLMVGNPEKFPLTMEIGILDAAQFGGSSWMKNPDGSVTLVANHPEGFKEFVKAVIPTQESTLENVEGNHVGSWNFVMTYHAATWKARLYYEHYFDDHSQLTWQYGRWKDGHIGIEVCLPDNPFVSNVLWEGLSTYDQTGPILYDGVAGSFGDVQQSGCDNYFNHEYSWQHWGAGLGNALIPGPIYNKDKTDYFKSTRVKGQHVGLSGNPSRDVSYRILLSYMRHWGTYAVPLDRQRHQFSSLYEVTYSPHQFAGWSVSLGCGLDKGNYLGNSFGGMLTVKKTGICFRR